MNDEIVEMLKQKIIYLKKEKGVTYQFMADKSGEGVTRFDIAHLVTDNRKIGKNKFKKLAKFIFNY